MYIVIAVIVIIIVIGVIIYFTLPSNSTKQQQVTTTTTTKSDIKTVDERIKDAETKMNTNMSGTMVLKSTQSGKLNIAEGP